MTGEEEPAKVWHIGAGSPLPPPRDHAEVLARAAAGDQLADLVLALHEHAVAAAELRADLDAWNDNNPEETP